MAFCYAAKLEFCKASTPVLKRTQGKQPINFASYTLTHAWEHVRQQVNCSKYVSTFSCINLFKDLIAYHVMCRV